MRVYRRGTAMALSELLPLLDHLGFVALDERPYTFRVGNERVHLYDIGIRAPEGCVLERHSADVIEAFVGLVRGAIESDGFNRLVLVAGLHAREVAMIRAYAKYLRQIGFAFSQQYVEDTLARHGELVSSTRPAVQGSLRPGQSDDREAAQQVLREQIVTALDAVPSLDEDRICRSFLTLIEATTRTNFFRGDDHLGVQVRPGEDPRTAAAPTGVRDLGVRAAGRGGSPPRRTDRPRRVAVERPARGLPHRGARADEGADWSRTP